jgi:hypothetical protein
LVHLDRYPYYVSEIVCSDIEPLLTAVVEHPDHLHTLWTILDSPAPLFPLVASYFSKINCLLVERKVTEVNIISAFIPEDG